MKRKRTDGSILILALWAVCLLAALSVILGYEVRQKIRLSYRLEEKESLSLVAQAGVMQALALVSSAEEKSWSALADAWSVNEPLFKDVALQGGYYRVGYDVTDEQGNTQTRFGLTDEERKVNVNTADAVVIERLCVALGIEETDAQGLAACIVDWRDKDSDVLSATSGAEDSYYRGLPDPYDAKDAPLSLPEELMLVKGMTPEFFEKLANYVTVYGSGKININTAPEPVLSALGLSQGVIRDIMSFRAGRDNVQGTADDGFFDTPLTITQKLAQSNALTEDEMTELANTSVALLGTESQSFLVQSRAYPRGGKVPGVTVRAVIDNKGSILYWQEN
jgi:general secretion pathway protein K